jgi:hypothetical protein
MKADLLSRRIRMALREELVGWPLGAIGDLFQSEGFAADQHHDLRVRGERRTYVEQFYVRIDWTDWDQVRRMLRIVEAVLDQMGLREQTDTYGDAIANNRERIEGLLRRDGFAFDENNAIRPRWEVLTQDSVRGLPDESAIPGHLRRMWDAVEERPEQAISAAKDAIESAAKHVLSVLEVQVTGRESSPASSTWFSVSSSFTRRPWRRMAREPTS